MRPVGTGGSTKPEISNSDQRPPVLRDKVGLGTQAEMGAGLGHSVVLKVGVY